MYTLIITTDCISGAHNLGGKWNYPNLSEAKIRLELSKLKEVYGIPSFVDGMMILKAKRLVVTASVYKDHYPVDSSLYI